MLKVYSCVGGTYRTRHAHGAANGRDLHGHGHVAVQRGTARNLAGLYHISINYGYTK